MDAWRVHSPGIHPKSQLFICRSAIPTLFLTLHKRSPLPARARNPRSLQGVPRAAKHEKKARDPNDQRNHRVPQRDSGNQNDHAQDGARQAERDAARTTRCRRRLGFRFVRDRGRHLRGQRRVFLAQRCFHLLKDLLLILGESHWAPLSHGCYRQLSASTMPETNWPYRRVPCCGSPTPTPGPSVPVLRRSEETSVEDACRSSAPKDRLSGVFLPSRVAGASAPAPNFVRI